MAMVLVVDDEQFVVEIMEIILRQDGHRVLAAHTGAEACRIAEDRTEAIDLGIIDENLPDAPGIEVARSLRRSHPAMKILRVSGRPLEDPEREGTTLPNSGFLEKPFNVSTLVEEVRRLLDAREDPRRVA